MSRFEGKVVFVTGGVRPTGMGFVTATAFVAEGASVFLFDRDAERLPDAVAELGEGARGRVGDVGSRADVEALAECERELGPVDVLVNQAGMGSSTHTLAIDEAEWDEVLDINLTGIFRVGQTVARGMADRGSGVVLNMASSGGIAAEPGHAHYAASKAAILALSRAMARALPARSSAMTGRFDGR